MLKFSPARAEVLGVVRTAVPRWSAQGVPPPSLFRPLSIQIEPPNQRLKLGIAFKLRHTIP